MESIFRIVSTLNTNFLIALFFLSPIISKILIISPFDFGWISYFIDLPSAEISMGPVSELQIPWSANPLSCSMMLPVPGPGFRGKFWAAFGRNANVKQVLKQFWPFGAGFGPKANVHEPNSGHTPKVRAMSGLSLIC